jgi:hypothetical protein
MQSSAVEKDWGLVRALSAHAWGWAQNQNKSSRIWLHHKARRLLVPGDGVNCLATFPNPGLVASSAGHAAVQPHAKHCREPVCQQGLVL